ncbi:AMP-dependent synthetase/ligase [Devriesea agamarum]|uniref:AMP-dependent synthetase/ligase n=1 Tax=Devriesea agamarum TaxID=472569 RepID=UPI00071C8BE8|nr:AMP-dependent synthetase/ligase [Devriesea agamarum]
MTTRHQFAVAAVSHCDPEDNITSLLLDRHNQWPQIPIFRRKDDAGHWQDVTSDRFLGEVRAIARGMLAAGLEPGDTVALISKTRYEWSLVDWAIWFAGGVSVPIYETSSPSQLAWVLADSGARFAVVESTDHAKDLDQVREEIPGVQRVWIIERGDLELLSDEGRLIEDAQVESARVSRKAADLATIIYTSGTTGRPKGARLTHANFIDTCRNAESLFGAVVMPPGSSTLMFLPLAHVFARLISVLAVGVGATVGHAPDVKTLLPDLASFRPEFLLAVPRVFEKIFNSAEQKAYAEGKGKIFSAAAHCAESYSQALDTGHVPWHLRASHKAFDALVYRKLRQAVGGRVRWSVSGGAPLGSRLGHFFRGVGITVLEGYGLTETTAPVSINPPWNVKMGTVGMPLPGAAVALADDGELLVKGSMVFDGYHRNEEATRAALRDGWFRTGDIAQIDHDGYISITGRTKEIIVTAGGKNIAPAMLEDTVRSHPLVSQCIVVGDQKPFVACLLTLDKEMLPTWLSNHGRPAMSAADAAQDEVVRAALQEAIDLANTSVSRAESIRAYQIIDADFTEDNGYLTPSLKLKRNVVVHDFADVIESIYARPRPGN